MIGFGQARSGTPPRHSRLARREAIAFYLFISPWIVGFLAFTLGPMLASLYFSFTSYDIVHAPQWIGGRNYSILFSTPLFWQSIKVTLSYGIPALLLGLVLGMALAILLNQKLPGLGIWRTIFYLPSVISGVPVALLWLLIFRMRSRPPVRMSAALLDGRRRGVQTVPYGHSVGVAGNLGRSPREHG